MIDISAVVKNRFDMFVSAVPYIPMPIRVIIRDGSIASYYSPSDSANPHAIVIGNNTHSMIDLKKPEDCSDAELEMFYNNTLSRYLGCYYAKQTQAEINYFKSFFDSNYKKRLFDILNMIRIRAQTSYVTFEEPMYQFYAPIETAIATQKAEYWWLYGIPNATDSAIDEGIYYEVTACTRISDIPEYVNRLAAMYPDADVDQGHLSEYRSPFPPSAFEEDADQIDDEEVGKQEAEEQDGSAGGIGYSPSGKASASKQKKQFIRKIAEKSGTPAEIINKRPRGLIDHWDSRFKIADKATVDANRVEAVKSVLGSVFVNIKDNKIVDTPTSILNPDSFTDFISGFGMVDYMQPGKLSRAPIRLDMVLDCSGSMECCIDDCRTLMLALWAYAKEGFITGYIYFCSAEGFSVRDWTQITEDELLSFDAYSGGEGIETCLGSMWQSMRDATIVCAFTDACLSENAWNKKDYIDKGVDIVGLYVGDESSRKGLEEYFHISVIQPTVEQVVESLVYQFKSLPMKFA